MQRKMRTKSGAIIERTQISTHEAGTELKLAPVETPPARELLKSTAAGLVLGLISPFTFSTPPAFGQINRAPVTPVAVRSATFVIPEYDEKREQNDLYLAGIFGGKEAIAAGNGFEPKDMWHNGVRQYRGNDNGRGHLDNCMHLYGSSDGNRTTELYIPRGYKYLGAMTTENGRENGGHTFFYKKLGTQRNVYLLVFHVKDFKIDRKDRNSQGSVRIGNIGGPGGAPPDMNNPPKRNGKVSLYLHSHLVIQKSPKGGTPGISFAQAFPTPGPSATDPTDSR